MPRLRVETGRRLVQEHQLRLVHERSRDRQPALHPARERIDSGLAAVGELDELEQLVDSPADLVAWEAEEAAVDLEVLSDVELLVEVVLLGDDAEALPDRRPVAVGVEAEDA